MVNWTLSTLKEALRAGQTPRDLGGICLGSGIDREAWRIGPFVVKESSTWYTDSEEHRARRDAAFVLLRGQLRRAPTVVVGEWDVQVMYRRLCPAQSDSPQPEDLKSRKAYSEWDLSKTKQQAYEGPGYHIDAHGGNVGLDHRGRMVCFDW